MRDVVDLYGAWIERQAREDQRAGVDLGFSRAAFRPATDEEMERKLDGLPSIVGG